MKKIIITCLCMLILSACGTKAETGTNTGIGTNAETGTNNVETTKEENSETIEIETDYDSMDFSKELNHINTIKEQTITEARIYHPSGQLFRTTDKEVLDNIVDKIAAIELIEIDPKTKEPVDGFSELYLLNGNHVVYHFTCDSSLSIGDKCYGPEESALEFEMKVMNYCRETFYIMQEE